MAPPFGAAVLNREARLFGFLAAELLQQNRLQDPY